MIRLGGVKVGRVFCLRATVVHGTLIYYLINLLINDICSVYNIYRSARIFRIKEAAHNTGEWRGIFLILCGKPNVSVEGLSQLIICTDITGNKHEWT